MTTDTLPPVAPALPRVQPDVADLLAVVAALLDDERRQFGIEGTGRDVTELRDRGRLLKPAAEYRNGRLRIEWRPLPTE